MFNVVLYQPEIPPNTGNIMRLCANVGCRLHLIEPLGFSLSDKHMKRAFLDYEMQIEPMVYKSFSVFCSKVPAQKLYLLSTKAKTLYTKPAFQTDDYFVFGPETRGLPKEILDQYPETQKLLVPMQVNTRSLNLANSVAIVVYEAWRQQGFSKF